MRGDVLLIDGDAGSFETWRRLPIGDTGGRNEAWLRDLLVRTPEIIPIKDIDPSFGPLIPLCTELRTDAGPIDTAFVNADGKITIVECKLWRNPEARRKVVAQTLDYAAALKGWTYSDLQRQVSASLNRSGNIPFERVKAKHPDIDEATFHDAVTRNLRAGRFLMMIVGDGVREGVEALAELINANAASAFQLAMVEAALYDAGAPRVAVQARVLAKTRVIERTFVAVTLPPGLTGEVQLEDSDSASVNVAGLAPRRAGKPELRAWWEPVLAMAFDDPDQAQPVYVNNFVRTPLPWPRLWLGAYWTFRADGTSIYLGGPESDREAFFSALGDDVDALLGEIEGAEYQRTSDGNIRGLHVPARRSDFPNPEAHRNWVISTLNAYVNAVRPRMKRLLETRTTN